MSVDSIFADITREMTRSLRLAHNGKFAHTQAHPDATNLESAAILGEEIGEATEEAVTLMAALLGLQQHQGGAVRTVNDIEQLLWRWRLDPPERMDSIDREHLLHLRCKLREELTQVAAVTISWILRLDEEEHKRLSKIRHDAHRQSET